MTALPPPSANRLGRLSAHFESGGRGPGAVSAGGDDPGGVSYGIYQLASRTGAVAAFLAGEGACWAERFGAARPGTEAFTRAWQAVAAQQPDAFATAQHGFIARTHYQPVVAAVRARTGFDLDRAAPALRDVAWSCAVQHAAAARLIAGAVEAVERTLPRGAAGHDAALVRAIYAARTDYLTRLGARAGGAVQTLFAGIVTRRYPAECAAALAMLAGGPPPAAPAPGTGPSGAP